jgi:phospholipid N-methyltransferase
VQKALKSLTFSVIFISSFFQLQATTLTEVVTIFTRFVHNPAQVGEIAPLSDGAAQELAKFIGQEQLVVGKRYCEAGGGCGAVSVQLAKKLQSNDHLDVIEIDAEMCELLKLRLSQYPNVTVHCCSILDWKPNYLYDGIISTLPFNSLGIDFTCKAIEHFKIISAEKSIFSYVEYPIVKQVFQYFYVGERKRNFKEVQRFLQSVRQEYLSDQRVVHFNVPPIAIYHLCFN